VIIDTSALLAILQLEPEARRLLEAIRSETRRLISAATFVEASIVAEGKLGAEGVRDLDAVIARLRIEIAPLTADHALYARRAFRRFGKGRHPAQLNLGDCFSYALSKASGEPLLFKGRDFSETDVAAVAY